MMVNSGSPSPSLSHESGLPSSAALRLRQSMALPRRQAPYGLINDSLVGLVHIRPGPDSESAQGRRCYATPS